MLNPFKLWAVYRDLNKIEAVAKEQASMKTKVMQYVTLVLSLIGTVGIPTMATTWLHAHMDIYMGLVAAAIVLHAIFPSIFSAPSAADTQATGLNKVGIILLLLTGWALLGPMQVRAQTPTGGPVLPVAPQPTALTNIYAAGASYNVGGSPAIAGTALYAHLVAGTGTYAFTAVDALPNTLKPFTVSTNIGVGIAQKVATLGKVPIYMPTAAGISWNGGNTGWQWNGGVLASIHVKNGYYIMPTVRFLKSSVSNGSGYQPIVGVLFGWGQ